MSTDPTLTENSLDQSEVASAGVVTGASNASAASGDGGDRSGAFQSADTRTDGTSYGTSAVNDAATNTVLAWALGASGFPELKIPGGIRFLYRNGNPNGVVNAPIGSICINTAGGAGTTLYVSEAGGTAWVGK